MRILGLFINNEFRTGANRRYIELIESLGERGHDVYVVMNSYLEYAPSRFTRIDVPVKYRRKGLVPASLLFNSRIRKGWQAILELTGRIDWIHIHSDKHLDAAIFLKDKLGARLFYSVRCDDITRARLLMRSGYMSPVDKVVSLLADVAKKRLRERRIAFHADRVAFMNAADRDSFLRRTGMPADKSVVITGNIGLPRFKAEWKGKNRSTGVRKLIYVGALSFSKGFYTLLDALAVLRDRGHRELTLVVLARTTHLEEVLKRVRRLGLEGMIEFKGYIPPFPELSVCDLMVYPTLYDAWGDVVMEAIFTGCPAIASSVGGLPELLRYPELLFEPGNAAGIADSVERAINDPQYYARIRELCARRVEALTFDWVDKYEEVMK